MSSTDLRTQLSKLSGHALLRSLDEMADMPEFRRLLRTHYPSLSVPPSGSGRRRFLTMLAATFALGGLAGCDRGQTEWDERSKIVPLVRHPTNMDPSAAMTYSSAVVFDGIANGAYVTTRNGRPIKIEGNPDHPWSRGGTDVFGQASVLNLYDPDRSQAVLQLNRPSDWESFTAAATSEMEALRARGGEGLRLLTGPISAPSLLKQIADLQKPLPGMQWHVHAPVGRNALYEGTRRAFGKPLETRWRFDQAQVVVSLDGDFLDAGPQQVGVSRAWTEARHAAFRDGRLLALYAAAATPSLTTAKADHPVVVPASAIASALASLEQVATGEASAEVSGPIYEWIHRAGMALRAAPRAGIVMAGAFQPPAVLEAVHRLNARLGNVGKTVFYTAPVLPDVPGVPSLVEDMRAGKVRAVFMLDVNPVYSTPAVLGFAEALSRVPFKVHAGSHADETAIRSDWHLPLKHPLESWGDPRALDGTVTLIQPAIRPLYDSQSVPEILSLLNTPNPMRDRGLLHAAWNADDTQWRNWLLAGFMEGTAFAPEQVVLQPAQPAASVSTGSGMRVLVRPDTTVWDGAEANNGWLQELPKPLTKLTWENVIAISPGEAAREQLVNGDIAVLSAGGRTIRGPVWVLPGQADDAITITLGYGRHAAGSVANGAGFNAYEMLPQNADAWEVAGATIRRSGDHRALAVTQEPNAAHAGDIVRMQALGAEPAGDTSAFTQPTFYQRVETDGRSWGMVIDLDSCIGCNACVVACQAENNIAVVGKDQVERGRDMHWLRVDRYYASAPGDHRTHFMPVPCMHCENAPCELGCPVEATLHDHEGLNLQIYNRCVGTRACSSYCPYKVRHFNYLDYTADTPPSLQAQFNPDVTVRARGVMEKCTYCVQRIVEGRITSDRENRPIKDLEVQTACQQACPTRAIVFGDMMQNESSVSAAKRDSRNYALLGELNTRPHTTYLAGLAPGKSEG